MSHNLIEIHHDEIFSLFKDNFKSNFLKKSDLNFDLLIQSTLRDLQITNYEKSDLIVFSKWFNQVYHFEILSKFINEDFEEIIFHDHKSIQIKKRSETLTEFLQDLNFDDWQMALEIICLKNSLEWNFSHPFISFNFVFQNNSFRATLTHQSLTPGKGSKLFLRRQQNFKMNIANFTESDQLNNFLGNLVKDKANVLIAGSTGSGKTSLLRTMLNEVNNNDHVIIIEDTHEINLEQSNVTNLLAHPNQNGKSLTDYCAYSMRMSPDRIILGELRSNEVVPFLLAMNSGQRGLISTIHANSAADTVSRLNLLFSIYSNGVDLNTQFVTELISRNIDYIIYLKDKKVIEVIKLLGSEGSTPYFETVFLEST